MDIAIVLMKYNPYGGYERKAVILAEELVKRGDNVTVKWKKIRGRQLLLTEDSDRFENLYSEVLTVQI